MKAQVKIRHVTLSVQDDQGRPVVSTGVQLETGYYSDEKQGCWYATVDPPLKGLARGSDELDAICTWLSMYSKVQP